MVRSWRLGLLIALSTCGLLSADRLAVQLRGGAKVSKAKRGKSAKKLEVHAYAADAPGLELRDYTYTEEVPLAADAVDVEVHACSLGSGDVQQLRGEWGPCVMPLVPGRDAVGVVVNVGSKVKGLMKGQRVAVLLGMGMDGEADDGADRSADSMTTGAAAHHLRVPARWAFPVPATLPTAHATGLVSVGGAIWAHLTQQRLERGAKIAVVGEGTAGQLAVSLAGHLGYDVYQLSEEPVPPVPEKSSKAARKAHKKRLHAADEAAGRLHGASFDAVLCVACKPELDLRPFLEFAKPGTAVLMAGSGAGALLASPRKMQERRLSIVGGAAASAKDVQRLLAFCAQHRVRLAQEAAELGAAEAAEALAALAEEPEARRVLVRSSHITGWLKANRTGAAVHAPAESGMSSTLGNVFGVFNKVAEETKNAAAAMREGVSSTAAKLYEEVEKDAQNELEARHGSLNAFDMPTTSDGDEDEDEDEEDEEDED